MPEPPGLCLRGALPEVLDLDRVALLDPSRHGPDLDRLVTLVPMRARGSGRDSYDRARGHLLDLLSEAHGHPPPGDYVELLELVVVVPRPLLEVRVRRHPDKGHGDLFASERVLEAAELTGDVRVRVWILHFVRTHDRVPGHRPITNLRCASLRFQASWTRWSGTSSTSTVSSPASACSHIAVKASRLRSRDVLKLVWPTIRPSWLRNPRVGSSIDSAAELPIWIKRPSTFRLPSAASAGSPQRGSTTTSKPPPPASLNCSVRSPAPPRSTTASAPSSRWARSRLAVSRAAATTRPAPSRPAACTAIWPRTPLDPRTRTDSPFCSSARQVSASHAASPEMPKLTARPSATPSGTSISSFGSTSVRSPIEPKGATGVSKYTRRPSATPIPSRPGTDGRGGSRPGKRPEAIVWSTGLRPATATSTTASPSARGSSN